MEGKRFFPVRINSSDSPKQKICQISISKYNDLKCRFEIYKISPLTLKNEKFSSVLKKYTSI